MVPILMHIQQFVHITSQLENGQAEKARELAKQQTARKEKLMDLEFELETLQDEINDDKAKKSAMKNKLDSTSIAEEKLPLRKKILEINKKLVRADEKKIQLEFDIEEQRRALENGVLSAAAVNVPPVSQAQPAVPADPRRKTAMTKTTMMKGKKNGNTDKNTSAATDLKKTLKKSKKTKAPAPTNGEPKEKIARRSDSPVREPDAPKPPKIVAPKLPTTKIRKKDPVVAKKPAATKPVTEKAVTKKIIKPVKVFYSATFLSS